MTLSRYAMIQILLGCPARKTATPAEIEEVAEQLFNRQHELDGILDDGGYHAQEITRQACRGSLWAQGTLMLYFRVNGRGDT